MPSTQLTANRELRCWNARQFSVICPRATYLLSGAEGRFSRLTHGVQRLNTFGTLALGLFVDGVFRALIRFVRLGLLPLFTQPIQQ
jgi:hypothetical protein